MRVLRYTENEQKLYERLWPAVANLRADDVSRINMDLLRGGPVARKYGRRWLRANGILNQWMVQFIAPIKAASSSGITDPRDISGLAAWYRSDLGITTSSGLVTNWNDQSGNSVNLTAASGYRPTYTSSWTNGHQGLTFSGHVCKTTTGPALTSPVTMFVFMSSTATDNTRPYYMFEFDHTNSWYFEYETADPGWGMNSGSLLSYVASSPTLAAHLWEITFNGASSEIRLSGVQKATGTAGTNNLTASTTFYMGAQGSFGDNGLIGVIGEFFWYNSNLSSGDRTKVRDYCTTFWGGT